MKVVIDNIPDNEQEKQMLDKGKKKYIVHDPDTGDVAHVCFTTSRKSAVSSWRYFKNKQKQKKEQ